MQPFSKVWRGRNGQCAVLLKKLYESEQAASTKSSSLWNLSAGDTFTLCEHRKVTKSAPEIRIRELSVESLRYNCGTRDGVHPSRSQPSQILD